MRSTGHRGHQRPAAAGRASADSPDRSDPTSDGPAGTILTRVACTPIRLYRALGANRPPHCRFWPSCSAYALEAIEVHGAGHGLWLAARRIAHCHPWGGSGVDPVPVPTTSRFDRVGA